MLAIIPERVLITAYMTLYLSLWNISHLVLYLEDFDSKITQRTGLSRPLTSKDYYVHSRSPEVRDGLQPLVRKLKIISVNLHFMIPEFELKLNIRFNLSVWKLINRILSLEALFLSFWNAEIEKQNIYYNDLFIFLSSQSRRHLFLNQKDMFNLLNFPSVKLNFAKTIKIQWLPEKSFSEKAIFCSFN